MKKNKKLNIAIIASNALKIPPIPPEKNVPSGWSGAPELIAHFLTEELVRRGHRVTLFASSDSATKADLVSCGIKSSWISGKISNHESFEHVLISMAYRLASSKHFDIIHSHFDTKTAYYAPLVGVPTVSTLHSPLEGLKAEILKKYKKTQYYVSISDAQREAIPDLNYAGTVHNGIEVGKIPFSDKKENYLIFAGRIHPDKGVYEAIKIAKKANIPLQIYGSHKEDDYWNKKVKPHIDGSRIIYGGIISRENLFDKFKKAKAFIFPLKWNEPFGLVAVESMASGTPVVAFPRGSMPEIIKNGKTGFLVENEDEMIDALKKVDRINSSECRKYVESNFSVEKMVDGYEAAYYKILEK